MMDAATTVLIVDDEFLVAEGLSAQIEEMGLTVCGTATTAEQAVSLAQAHSPSVVLMDVRLDGARDGVDAALEIYSTVRSRVIFVTGSREPATIARIELDHASGVLFKPVSSLQLKTAIEVAVAAAP